MVSTYTLLSVVTIAMATCLMVVFLLFAQCDEFFVA